MSYGYGVQTMDTMFSIVFLILIAVFVVAFVKGIEQWHKNNNSPRLEVNAVVIAKRVDVSHTTHANAGDVTGAHGHHTTASTTYYVTFQVISGDRMEFSVNGDEYGMLMEGDAGKLHFQGTRYLGFERENSWQAEQD